MRQIRVQTRKGRSILRGFGYGSMLFCVAMICLPITRLTRGYGVLASAIVGAYPGVLSLSFSAAQPA